MTNDGHKYTSTPIELSVDDENLINKFKQHQQNAAKLSYAEEVRTLIDQSIGYGKTTSKY